ncbi:MAG: hypothetical protein EB059_05610 [Alphaproteobacteria bacterium]|nr:hypothetical protein [Alphaproteobacteria bacterium]
MNVTAAKPISLNVHTLEVSGDQLTVIGYHMVRGGAVWRKAVLEVANGQVSQIEALHKFTVSDAQTTLVISSGDGVSCDFAAHYDDGNKVPNRSLSIDAVKVIERSVIQAPKLS